MTFHPVMYEIVVMACQDLSFPLLFTNVAFPFNDAHMDKDYFSLNNSYTFTIKIYR